MPNKIQGQVGFPAQAPADAIYNVGPGCLFTTIQAAIDQAVADGYTTAANPALVQVAPGAYAENVAFKPGVNVVGLASAGQACIITGNCTYSHSAGGTRNDNTITVTNLTLRSSVGITMLVAGTSPLQLTFIGCSLEKNSGGDTDFIYSITSTGAGTRVRFNQGCVLIHNVAASVAMNLARGTTEFRQRNTAVLNNSGGTMTAAAVLTNSAALRVWGCDLWCSGAYTNNIDIQGAGAVVDLLHTWLQNSLAGGNAILFTAAGTARLKWTLVGVNADLSGYIAKGAAGTFIYSACIFLTPNDQVQNTLTIQTENTAVTPVA